MALDAILDTRFIFSLLAPESEEVARWARSTILKAEAKKLGLGCSVISATEFYVVTKRMLRAEEVATRLYSLEALGIRFLDVNKKISEIAGMIGRGSDGIPIADTLIAATAISQAGGKVLSDDAHFSRIKGIKQHWLSSP